MFRESITAGCGIETEPAKLRWGRLTKGLFARRRPNSGFVGGRGFCVNFQKI
jgi:hypothetical protein